MYKILILFLIFLLSGCGLLKNVTRTKDKTITKTEIFVDTVISVYYDTIPIYDTVPIYDTAFLENKTSQAKSYFDIGMNKIVLELKNKPFDVPIKLHKKETKTEIKKETESKPNYLALIIIGILFCILLVLFKIFK